MSKVYMRADENEAGVTVEDHSDEDATDNVFIGVCPSPKHVKAELYRPNSTAYLTDTEARAVVEGLLRRMLEREGSSATWNLVNRVMGTPAESERGATHITDGRLVAEPHGRMEKGR